MYYCNKCGHMGPDGPGHCRPVPIGGLLQECGYDAVKLHSGDAPLQPAPTLNTTDTIALWGSIASASAWSAAGAATGSPLCAGIAAAWLGFAALIYWTGKKGSGAAAEAVSSATNRA